MNTISNFGYKRPVWQNIVILTLGFWLSASLVIDWVIMPSLYVSGMMSQASFAQAGYTIFWNFNRIELLSAGLVLTGILALNNKENKLHRGMVFLAILLLGICLVDTYILTPQMSAIGLQMNLLQTTVEIPFTMNMMHGGYWILEVIKLVAGCTLFSWFWRE
ncbi:MAG: DUF4149 domain-containing protein [Calothrix sp. MO_167.B42]|nr:DUF4149 domain-containing protein [Calothrix sp. MO_167.B42]